MADGGLLYLCDDLNKPASAWQNRQIALSIWGFVLCAFEALTGCPQREASEHLHLDLEACGRLCPRQETWIHTLLDGPVSTHVLQNPRFLRG